MGHDVGVEDEEIEFTRTGRGGRPLAVLLSGAPGAGKTTLANRLGDVMRMPVVSNDRVRQATLWTLGTDDLGEAPPGPPLFYGVMESYLRLGVSVIGDMTLRPGLSEPDVAARLAPCADLVVVHCRTAGALLRFERRTRRDPVHRLLLARVLPEVRHLQESVWEPLDLGCPTIIVDTTDEYEPTLAMIVSWIARHGVVDGRGGAGVTGRTPTGRRLPGQRRGTPAADGTGGRPTGPPRCVVGHR